MPSLVAAWLPFVLGLVTYGFATARIVRFRSAEGTSATSLAVTVVSCAAWAFWAAGAGLWPLVWVNVLWVPVLVVPELLAMWWVRPVRWNMVWLVPAWVVVVVGSAVVSSLLAVDLLGMVVALSGLLWLVPAVFAVFRSRGYGGVSRVSWLVSCVSASAWGAFGAWEGAWVPVLYSAVTVAGCLAVLARVAWASDRRG